MNNMIEEALKETEIPCFYIKRPKKIFHCIVYSYKEYTGAMGDNDEENTKYDIFLNFITKNNINENLCKIKETLKKSRFKKIVINQPEIFEINGEECYQITMNYQKRVVAN